MDNSLSNDAKKVNLEELSREDLVKKCRGLLTIAQKAKQAKDVIQEENNRLKQELADKSNTSNDVSQEIIEKLTQQKLAFVTTIEDLKAKNSSLDSKLQIFEKELDVCQEKLYTTDNENVSYRRQVTRLTDENEQLLAHLESLEKQIDELNKVGIQQREQLLELEAKASENKCAVDDNKISELQCMLSVSLEEIRKLKSENIQLNEKVGNLQINLSEKDKNIVVISEELQSKCDILNKVTNELEDKDETRRINELQELNTSLKSKLKLYHSKIIKFAGNAKSLKEEKNKILQLFKLYTDQVKEWKEQLQDAGRKLIVQVGTIELENKKLLQEKIDIENKLSESMGRCEAIKNEKDKELTMQRNKNAELMNEIVLIKQQKESINRELVVQKENNVDLTNEVGLLKGQSKLVYELENKCLDLSQQVDSLTISNKELQNEINQLTSEKKSIDIIIKEKEIGYKKQLEESRNKQLDLEKQVSDLNTQLKTYEDNREHIEATEKQLADRSCEEIKNLADKNKELTDLSNALQEKLDEIDRKRLNVFHCESQTEDDLAPTNELEEQIQNLKRENAELLSEMTEMNEAIKERGETISRLDVHRDEIMKKLQIYEAQANKNVDSITQKEEIIRNLTKEIKALKLGMGSNDANFNNGDIKDEEINSLKIEIEALREKLNANIDVSYAESETMSTSTISRTEDANRLKDLEGPWEEKYSKLRNLAVKLKGKVRELSNSLTKEQNEKDELQKKVTANLKTIQSLQNQSDRLQDELDKSKEETKQYLNRLNTIAEDISKDKKSLVSQDDVIGDLKREIESLKNDKQSTENWKKQVSAKVQTLRKELEINNALKKEFESKVVKLTTELEEKEKALKIEIENHKQTKNQLELSNNECKKNSVLNLEMQDYERSVKETSKKLEKQQEQISNLKTQVDSHKSTISALREQNKLLENRVNDVEMDLNSALTEMGTYKKKVAQLEDELQQRDDKIQESNRLLEISRSENEELSTELSKVITEHQKVNDALKIKRDHLRGQAMGLQQSLRDIQDALKLKEEELGVTQKEYEGYKVRAQSVLRQNQNRDVGLEEKLSNEMANLKVENVNLRTELDKNLERLRELEAVNEKLSCEKGDGIKRVQEMEAEVEELNSQYAQLVAKHQKSVAEHAETVRSLKLHADTLSQCYRQQISEQEIRHNREVIELQSRIEKAPSPAETPPVLATMTREEGEGSESIESNNAPNVYPVPLERLLGSDSDQEVILLKKLLNEHESKLVHLTALLSDTEQDLAKHVQMNDLLKEEIRRQQRSLEREEHAENLEYLKNVVFKFVTLNSGDERSRLVPVLNTILKLSPDETHKLNAVAKGDSGIKAWANYLPTWPSPNKP